MLCLLWLVSIAANAEEIPNDEIWYEASEKLSETTSSSYGSLRTDAFNTSISSHTFSEGKGVIKFNESVTSIGYDAFLYCSSLTSITIPNSVTSIGLNAFYHCSGLKSVTIGNSVTSIGEHAFQYCSSLTSINIPNSVTYIGEQSFCGCSSLPAENNLRYAGNYLVEAADKTLSSYTIKEGTKWIGCEAFYDCSNMASITIPNSVTSIGGWAFGYCSGLESITIPNSVTSIGESAFYSCSSLTSITIPNSVTYIGNHAFSHCYNLTSITIPNSVTSIGDHVFIGCSDLTSITIPNSVTSIGGWAFGFCSGLESITIPNSVISIGSHAFEGCSGLTSITIPNSVTSIGSHAFEGCSGLTSITIPNSVTSIGEYAFSYCYALTSFTVNWTEAEKIVIPPLNAFYDIDLPTLHIPVCTKELYKAADVWKDFGRIVSKNCLITDKSGNEEQYELSDGDNLQINDDSRLIDVLEDIDLSQLTYSRTFKNTNWQPLYVPFDMDVTSELLGNFSFAKFAGTYTDDDGSFCITITKLNEGGKIKANTPYFIKAKVADSSNPQTISVAGATLKQTHENSIYMLSAEKRVTVYGIYSRKTFTAADVKDENIYAYGGGTYNRMLEGNALGAFRFYLKITHREGNMYASETPSSIKLKILGKYDNATGVDSILSETKYENAIVYDLMGRRIMNPHGGIFIVNGKKMFIK